MRAFFAVLPPTDVLAELSDYLEPRHTADTDRTWRWTRREHVHLTLAFLARLPEHREDELIESTAAWAKRQRPLRLQWGRAGAFPDPGRAKVVWVGVQPEKAQHILTSWSRALRDQANHAGAEVDGHRFFPHVTVARSSRRVSAGRWVQSLDAFQSSEFRVEQIVLLESHLGEGPGRSPRYEQRHVFPLG